MTAARRPKSAELSKEQQLEIYYYLLLTRSLEDRLENLLKQGKVAGLFRSLGQEATAVASAYALERECGDILSPLTRDLGAMLVIGARPREVISQYMARGTSPTGGREQNIHFTDIERGFIGTISPLGNLVAVMNGVVLATRMQGKKTVGMAYIGDGATSTGVFHEAANFAAAQQLPLVIIAENNGYAYTTPVSRHMRILNLAERAKAYGIPSEIVDGNDAIAVFGSARRGVERARSGGGPTLIEAKTFRMRGHAAHDNQSYVPKSLLEEWKKRDPILHFEKHLNSAGVATKSEMEEVRKKVDALLDEEVAWSEAQPLPAPETALGGVYANDSRSPGE